MAQKDAAAAPFFERRYDLTQMPRHGLEDRIEATPAERAAIAAAQGLQALESLIFSFELRPLARGRWRLKGRVDAAATQSCVVTLDPVPAQIGEEVELELWPDDQIADPDARAAGAEIEVSLEGPEAYSDGTVDLGQLAYEVFASALEPYPRKPGAEFAWTESREAEEQGAESPFAVLRNLKRS